MFQLRSVDAGYGTFQALFGTSLEVNAGEAVGVIGPNGAGTTTLMRVISGLIRPTAGSITMQGTDVVATPAHRIVSLGIAHVPENREVDLPQIREVLEGPYRVIYHIKPDQLDIIAVIHGSQQTPWTT